MVLMIFTSKQGCVPTSTKRDENSFGEDDNTGYSGN